MARSTQGLQHQRIKRPGRTAALFDDQPALSVTTRREAASRHVSVDCHGAHAATPLGAGPLERGIQETGTKSPPSMVGRNVEESQPRDPAAPVVDDELERSRRMTVFGGQQRVERAVRRGEDDLGMEVVDPNGSLVRDDVLPVAAQQRGEGLPVLVTSPIEPAQPCHRHGTDPMDTGRRPHIDLGRLGGEPYNGRSQPKNARVTSVGWLADGTEESLERQWR